MPFVPTADRRSMVLSVILPCIAALAVSGCGGSPQAAVDYPIISDSAGVKIVDNGPIQPRACEVSAEPVLSIGVVEGEEEYQFHHISGAAKLSNGNVVVMNRGSNELRIFGPSGNYLHSGGSAGEGPGEFGTTFGLRVLPGDSIWVGNYRPWKFEIFNSRGVWIRSVHPYPTISGTPAGWGILGDGSFVMGIETPMNRQDLWDMRIRTLYRYDTEAVQSDSLDSLDDGRWGLLNADVNYWASPLFESFAQFDARNQNVAAGHGSTTEFGTWTTPSIQHRTRLVRWNEQERMVTSDDVEREHVSIAQRNNNVPPELYDALVGSQTGADRPIADVMPAFTEIYIGLDGSYWLKSHAARSEEGQQHWKRFVQEGMYSCTATLPDRLNIYEFGSDYILARDRDEEGVERVVEYQMDLQKPGL